jgi:hypothetical protein
VAFFIDGYLYQKARHIVELNIKFIKMKNSTASSDATIRPVSDLFTDSVTDIKDLFPEGFFNQYMTPDEVLDQRKELGKIPHGLDYTSIIYHNCSQGLRITSPLLLKNDKYGNEYYWTVFSNGAGSKAVLTEGFKAFLNDYQNGLIKPKFDYRSLLEAALKAIPNTEK